MKKVFKIFFLSVLAIAFFLGAAIPAVNLALQSENLRNTLLSKAALILKGKMEADGLAVSLDTHSLNIRSENLRGSLLNNRLQLDIPDLRLSISYTELLQGSFFPRTFKAASPHISYQRQPTSSTGTARGNWSQQLNIVLRKILGNGAHIAVTDAALELEDIALEKLFIETKTTGLKTELELRTDIVGEDFTIPLLVSGSAKKKLPLAFSYSLDIRAKSIPLNRIPGSDTFFFSGGTADFSGKISGSRKDMDIAGDIAVQDLDMTVGWISEDGSVHQEKQYRINTCTLSIAGSLQGRKIELSQLDLQSDDFGLQGSLVLDYTQLTDPSMDLRFKSKEMDTVTLKKLLPDPLINDWTTQNIFPNITNGRARITDFVLSGSLEDISRLDEPEYAHCLSWSGILTNTDTFYNDHLPLAHVQTAHLSMQGDTLTVSRVKAQTGTSSLADGSVSISHLYNDTMQVTTAFKGSFSLQWLLKIFRSGLVGTDLQKMVHPLVSLSGQADGDVQMVTELTQDEFSFISISGKGIASSVDLQSKKIKFPLKSEQLQFSLTYPGTSTLSGRGSWGKSTFTGTMDLIDLEKKQHIQLNIQPDLAQLRKLWSDTPLAHTLAPCITKLPLSADISFAGSILSGSGSVDFSRLQRDTTNASCPEISSDNALTKGEYAFTYKPPDFKISKILLKAGQGTIQLTGRLKQQKKKAPAVRELHLKAAEFPVQALSPLVPEKLIPYLHGTLDMNVKTGRSSSADLWSVIQGNFALKGWQGSLYPLITLDNMNVKGSIENGLYDIKGWDIRIKDINTEYPMTIHADLQKKNLWHGTVRIYSEYLDLSTIPSLFKKGKTVLSDTLPIESLRILGQADHVRYRKIIFTPLLIKSHITNNKFIINKGLLQQGNDIIWLTGMTSGENVVYESYFKFRDQPVNPLIAMMGFENNFLKGSLDLEGNLQAEVTPGATIFEKSKGPISFEIKNGSVHSSSTFVKILDLISLENIFNKKDVLLWKNNFKFDTIQGRFDLHDGIFTTDSFVMDAAAFDLFAEGFVDPLHDNMEMNVKLAPFGTINKILSSIPYLGFVLTGKSKSLFDYTLSVKGPLGDADVKYIPLKGTMESLTGYLKRLVSRREDVKKEINMHLQEDMARKNAFIQRMHNEMAPLMTESN